MHTSGSFSGQADRHFDDALADVWALWLLRVARRDLNIPDLLRGHGAHAVGGCAINDYADRNFDPHVERTRLRPIAAGELAPREALAVAAVLALAAFALVLFLNRFAIALSFVGLAVAATYPYSKRYFSLPQAYLGIAFGFGIPMAYAAVQQDLPLECWLLLAANVFYSFAYDTEYAMVDREDDAKLGIHTSALTLGRWDVAAVMASYAAMLLLLALLGLQSRLGWPFYVGLAAGGAMMVSIGLIAPQREGCSGR